MPWGRSSLLPLLLLVGVAAPSHPPMAAQRGRMCAHLCPAGLGSPACGPSCPGEALAEGVQFFRNGSTGAAARAVCPALCSGRLGEPFCRCPRKRAADEGLGRQAALDRVCSTFCRSLQVQLFGCYPCPMYAQKTAQPRALPPLIAAGDGVNWDDWCQEMCSQGDGGAACNCDILPLLAPVRIA